MQPLFSRLITLPLLGLLLSLLLAACGNPGALYLPDEQRAEGNQESTEYIDAPGPAGFEGVPDEEFLGDPDGPAMDEEEALDESDEEGEEEEAAFEQDRESRPGP